MKHGSLFSGIGGFDLAADWMGWENVFHCEWNEFGQRILNHYWPKAISYADITETDFTIHRGQIDVLTGGFPCQPYSQAGKRRGKDDERHLWPEMLRAIGEIKPRWVVGENVYGIVNWNGGMVFEEVQVDLEDEGYEVQPYILPAAGVGAPHQRYRVWFVAYYESDGSDRASIEASEEVGRQNGSKDKQSAKRGEIRDASDPESKGSSRLPVRKEKKQSINGITGGDGDAANANIDERPEGRMHPARPEATERHACSCNALSDRGEAWDNFPTQSPVCSGDDGLSPELDGITFSKWRRESIKGYGNAIVPQVVYQVFKAIEEYEAAC